MNRNQYELYHYGVKGMKWGHRKKYYNSDGSLNDKGVKKYAKKAYAQNQLKNEGHVGRAYDRLTGAHKISANMQYGMNSKAKNRKAANDYVNSMNSPKPKKQKTSMSQTTQKIKSGTKKATGEMKRILNDYKKNPILAMRDYANLQYNYEVAKFAAGPALKKGKKAAQKAVQRYYDKHPTYIY